MIRKYTFNPPIQQQAGDEFRNNGRWLEQWRTGIKIQQWDLNHVPSENLDQFESFGSPIATLYLEQHMPGQNVSMTNVAENQTTGVVRIDFSSGTQLELANWQDAAVIADGIDSSSDLAEKILIGKAYRASPDGVNKTTQVGAMVSANLLADTPIVYTEPQS